MTSTYTARITAGLDVFHNGRVVKPYVAKFYDASGAEAAIDDLYMITPLGLEEALSIVKSRFAAAFPGKDLGNIDLSNLKLADGKSVECLFDGSVYVHELLQGLSDACRNAALQAQNTALLLVAYEDVRDTFVGNTHILLRTHKRMSKELTRDMVFQHFDSEVSFRKLQEYFDLSAYLDNAFKQVESYEIFGKTFYYKPFC